MNMITYVFIVLELAELKHRLTVRFKKVKPTYKNHSL